MVLGVSSLSAQEKTLLGKTAEGWTRQLRQGNDAKARRSAAFALGKMGRWSASALPAMKAVYAGEKDAKVREAIVFAMAEICREGAGDDLGLDQLFIAALADNDPRLRRSAAFALGCLKTKSADMRKALDQALSNDREPMVRQNATWAIGRYGESALPSLARALRDADSLVKRDAASALLHVTSDVDKVHELLKDLLPLCQDKNSETRRAGLNVLLVIVVPDDKSAIDPLRSLLDDADIENRRNAAMALSNIGGDEAAAAVPVLLEAAKNGGPEVRRQAVLGIRNFGAAGAAALPDLMRFLKNDRDPQVRENAAFAIGGIGKLAERAVPLLVEMLQNTKENPDVRTKCAMALARIGPVDAARKAVPDLLAILTNSQDDPLMRERIIWALQVHKRGLAEMDGTKDAFAKVLKEPATEPNKMLRYNCAYVLGLVWQAQAPEHALDVLSDFLHDPKVKIFLGEDSGVGGTSNEGQTGKGEVKVRAKGDGRVMAADALLSIGPTRYAARREIMTQLNKMAAQPNLFEPLRKRVTALLDATK